ncbi:MAG: hypothetical protein IH948_10020 [Bacteroidetes bacterium]|nr:hypothetical protein [Bacteroidota bacterium]
MLALKKAGLKVLGHKFKTNVDKNSLEGNPNGYWELGKITFEEGLTNRSRNVGKKGDIVKVMFEVLPNSDPNLIDKAIVIFREPRCVLSSIFKYNEVPNKELFILALLLHIIVSLEFLVKHNKEFIIVTYEELLKEPNKMKGVCEFMGGNYIEATRVIDPKLNRSKKIKEDYKNLDLMEDVYEWARTNQIYQIIDYKYRIQKEYKELYAKNNQTSI